MRSNRSRTFRCPCTWVFERWEQKLTSTRPYDSPYAELIPSDSLPKIS